MKHVGPIGGLTLKPGSAVDGTVNVGHRPDGSQIVIQFMAKVGEQPGPVVCLEAGFTGDAHEGMFALPRILGAVDPKTLHGSVIVVPMINIPLFELQHRGNPFDPSPIRLGADTNERTVAEQAVAAFDSQILASADYLVSFYNWSPTLNWSPQVAFLRTPKSQYLAQSLGDGWESLWRVPQAPGTGLAAAAARRIPAIAIQAGDARGQMPADREVMVESMVQGVLNLLRRLRMIGGQWKPAREWIVRRETAVRNVKWGLLVPEKGVKIGSRIAKGSPIFRVWNIHGEEIECVASPVEGTLAAARTFPCAQPGQTIAYIAESVRTIR